MPPVSTSIDPIQELNDYIYRIPRRQSQGISIPSLTKPAPVEFEPKPKLPLSQPDPVLRPEDRYESSLNRLYERPAPFESLSSYQRQLDTTTQSGRAATQSLVQIMEAKRAEAQARAAERLANARRTPDGKITQAYSSRAPSNPTGNIKLGQNISQRMFGWSGKEWNDWYTLGMRESGWRNTAQNPTSTAFGIGQFLDGTWKTVGGRKTTDPYSQIILMGKYIKQRYGSPSRALAFWNANGWY